MSRHPYTADVAGFCSACSLPEGNARHRAEPATTVAQARDRVDRRAEVMISAADRRAVDEALTALARSGRSFSANELRGITPDDTPGAAIGPRFTAAARAGLIEPTGRYVMSSDPATRHRLTEWRGVAHPPRTGV